MTDIQIEISSGVTASTEGTMTFTHMRPFVNATNVRLGVPVTAPRVMTLEHNQAILDGSLEEFPDNPSLYEWGLMSDVVSGSDGALSVEVSVTMTWTTPQTSNGITLVPYESGENFVRRASATWYNQSGGVMVSGAYDLDADGIIEKNLSGYYGAKIVFMSTNIPRRMVWLRRISYGILFQARNEDISTCHVIEEAPESSDIAPSGTLDFSIVVKSQRMRDVLRTVKNGALLPMKVIRNGRRFGSFFIDQSEDVHGDGSKFGIRALSPVGAMDNTRFYGDIYSNKSVSQLVAEIMQTAFPRGEIAANVSAGGVAIVTGYMPICTCREALQQVAFTSDRSISCTRDGVINLFATRTTPPAMPPLIPLSEIYQGSKSTQTPQYTAIDVTGYVFQLNEARQITVVYAVLSPGDYTYEFSEPLGELYLTGADFVTRGANRAVIRVASSSEVYLRGTTYIKTAQTYRVNGLLSGAARENICRFDSTLLYSPNVPNIALHLWSDVSRSIVNDDIIVLKERTASDYVVLERTDGRTEAVRIERLDMDLRGDKGVIRTLTGRIEGTLQPAPGIPQPPVTSIRFNGPGDSQFGSIHTFTAPVSGTYRITAAGPHGAGRASDYGRGAYIVTTQHLTAGSVLDLIIGGNGVLTYGVETRLGPRHGAYVGSGGGGYTAAFIRTPTGRYTRLGIPFDCIVMAAGGGGAGYLNFGQTIIKGQGGDATTIYSPSNPRYPSSIEYIDPNETTPVLRNNAGTGVHQYINYAGAGARIAGFYREYNGAVRIHSATASTGGFGGGGTASVLEYDPTIIIVPPIIPEEIPPEEPGGVPPIIPPEGPVVEPPIIPTPEEPGIKPPIIPTPEEPGGVPPIIQPEEPGITPPIIPTPGEAGIDPLTIPRELATSVSPVLLDSVLSQSIPGDIYPRYDGDGGPTGMPGGGGGWVHDPILFSQDGMSGYVYKAYSWCSGTVVESKSNYAESAYMIIEWTAD